MTQDVLEKAIKLNANIQSCGDVEFSLTIPEQVGYGRFVYQEVCDGRIRKEIPLPKELEQKIHDMISDFKKEQLKELKEL